MDQKNLNQYQDQKRIEPKIGVSKDNKWIIINIPVIKPVAYFEKIIERAKNGNGIIPVEVERVED